MTDDTTTDRIERRLRSIEFAIYAVASFGILMAGAVMAVLTGGMQTADGVQLAIIAGTVSLALAVLSSPSVVAAINHAGRVVNRWRGKQQVTEA